MVTQPEAIIIRTAWVFSEYGNNFVKTMLRLAQDRDVLGIVSDQRGCPTYAGDIAAAIIDLLKADAEGGIYHFAVTKMLLGTNSPNLSSPLRLSKVF